MEIIELEHLEREALHLLLIKMGENLARRLNIRRIYPRLLEQAAEETLNWLEGEMEKENHEAFKRPANGDSHHVYRESPDDAPA